MDDYENFTERMTSFDLTLTGDETQDLALIHYGVKGMKWGVIREDRRAAKREKRAQVHDEVARRAAEDLKALGGPADATRTSRKLERVRLQAIRDAEAKREGRLTDKERRLVVGAAVVGVVILGAVAYKSIESGQAKVLVENGKDFIRRNREASTFKKNESLSRWNMDVDELQSEVVKHINPGYGELGTKNNCRRATFAYEMRRRGYDVKATKTIGGEGQNAVGVYNALGPNRKKFETTGTSVKAVLDKTLRDKDTPLSETVTAFGSRGFKPVEFGNLKIQRSKEIFENLASYPNGARGELSVGWAEGGGHSMAWEIVRGKPIIFDAQNGQTFKSPVDFGGMAIHIDKAGTTRLDDLPINEEFLRRWVKNV